MITTCLHCPLKLVNGQTCEIFTRATQAIRGSGVTSAKIRCDKRKHLLRPGQYVTFLGRFRGEKSEFGAAPLDDCFGWIWKFDVAKNKWLICGENTDSPFVRIRPDRIIALDDNEKRCCTKCGKPEGVADSFLDRKTGGKVSYVCFEHWQESGGFGGSWVDKCSFVEKGDEVVCPF